MQKAHAYFMEMLQISRFFFNWLLPFLLLLLFLLVVKCIHAARDVTLFICLPRAVFWYVH